MTDNALPLACDLARQFEGSRLSAYQDSGGRWTIGYGRAEGVYPGMTCSQDEADAWLEEAMGAVLAAVRTLVTVTLNDNQAAALADFAYNVGVGAFEASTLLHLLNEGDYEAVPGQLARWVRAAGFVLDGLVRRREAEAALWNATA